MLFAEKLKELRMAKGWSQKQLAEAAGTAQQNIGRWESGERTPLFDAAIAICKALGVRTTVFEDCDFAEVDDKRSRGRPTNADKLLGLEHGRSKKKVSKK